MENRQAPIMIQNQYIKDLSMENFLSVKPLEIETAKASIASPTDINRISKMFIYLPRIISKYDIR